jgi:hypothetical protein
MTDVATVKSDILEHVDANWKQSGRPLLLSKLGSLLGAKRLEIEAMTGLKLKPFVTIHLRDDCQILENPNDANILGLVPKGVELTDDISFYFSRQAPTGGAPPRYRPSFWAAFAKPMPPGLDRYIRMSDLRFFDQPETAPAPQGMLRVERERVPPENIVQRDVAVQLAITDWLQENSIDRTSVLVPRSAQFLSAVGFDAGHTSLLELLVTALDDGDLKRFDLPMDVVAKLLRARLQ